ncbi:hypothetical protein ACKKC3_002815 [Escherichia coli]
MSNIDKQWLQQKIADMEEHRDLFPGDLDDDHGSVLAALRIALASLEAEPSYFVNRVKHSDAYGEDVELRTYCYELDALKSKDDFGGEIVPVYTAPPAPFALPVQHWEDLCRQNPDMSIGDAIIRASWWNHCAAMLQGAEKAESTTTMQTAPALDSSPKIAESTSGNSPVIPDGWVMVPIEPTAEMQSVAAGVIRFDTTPINKLWTGNAVYRAMIAAAPQQEVK